MINLPIPSHPDPPSTTSALNSYWFFTNCSIWIILTYFLTDVLEENTEGEMHEDTEWI